LHQDCNLLETLISHPGLERAVRPSAIMHPANLSRPAAPKANPNRLTPINDRGDESPRSPRPADTLEPHWLAAIDKATD
jgi:hypothetical protein